MGEEERPHALGRSRSRIAVNFVLEIQAAMTRRAMQLRYYKLQSGC